MNVGAASGVDQRLLAEVLPIAEDAILANLIDEPDGEE
ncbi:hypothetical protein GGQ80_002089 [Sphingomonas jinjuensis]|uniref:Uncharacterized protein n=2 Tax=Sphingomonas jinjuensis TaxID=535907 RepID=A0A840F905_9SPHN|nr:hypothetical protein [Sphingomonas jinjuensis]